LGEVAGDRVLDVQRFGLPVGLFAATQPRLGRRPPLTRRAGGRTPPATTPRRRARVAAGPGSAGRYPAPRQVAARSGRGRRRAAPHGLARPAPKGLGRLPTRPRSPRLHVVRTGLFANQCDTGAMDEELLPPREERARLSESRLETHQHGSPASATCCYSLLLDPHATMTLTCTNGCSCWSPDEENSPKLFLTMDVLCRLS
jgi:hypothetical protein